MELKATCEIYTPAKINFFLNILGKRSDGYHELLMDLVPISLFDKITFTPPQKSGVELISSVIHLQQKDNLVLRAVHLLEKESGHNFDGSVGLDKAIPSGVGLGSGSGNAAGTLVALNRLFGLNIPISRLKRLASELGADVPFFVAPVPSIARGIGDQFNELPPVPPLSLLILFPGFSISTRDAYHRCAASGRLDVIEDYSLEGFRSHTADRNDFWIPLQCRYRELTKARSALLDHRAIASGLSGSGSALYAVFSNEEFRNRAYKNLRQHS